MIYHGRVKNGMVVFDPPVSLPEDVVVKVEIEQPPTNSRADSDAAPTWAEVFRDIIGKAEGLPSDSSLNHDHYLYGLPKR